MKSLRPCFVLPCAIGGGKKEALRRRRSDDTVPCFVYTVFFIASMLCCFGFVVLLYNRATVYLYLVCFCKEAVATAVLKSAAFAASVATVLILVCFFVIVFPQEARQPVCYCFFVCSRVVRASCDLRFLVYYFVLRSMCVSIIDECLE